MTSMERAAAAAAVAAAVAAAASVKADIDRGPSVCDGGVAASVIERDKDINNTTQYLKHKR